VHELLKYLESVNFPHSPRVLGFDTEGREVLTYIEGESGKEGWKKIITDDGLRKYAKLLRTYHDAVKDFKPQGLEWANGEKELKSGQILCHSDFGTWNIVWQGNEPIGIVDWDLARPAPVEFDILYAIEWSAPFCDDENALKWRSFSEVPDRKHRIEIFLEAYGAPAIPNIVAKVAKQQREVAQFEAYLANRGIQPQADWVASGDLDEIEKRAKWSEENAGLF